MTKIVKCDCKHKFQDGKYGEGKRVANSMGSGKDKPQFRCTVCSKVHG